MNYAQLREQMVAEQLVARGLRQPEILAAFQRVPREEFVPGAMRGSAYEDCPLAIGCGQTISQPYMTALMTEVLAPLPGEKILEIGTGSGYQAAILQELGCRVYTTEIVALLAQEAQQRLQRLGYTQIHCRHADGSLGWEDEAPFAGIMITAAALQVPPPLSQQLSLGGRLVMPRGGMLAQTLVRIEKPSERSGEQKTFGGCVFVPLTGAYGLKK